MTEAPEIPATLEERIRNWSIYAPWLQQSTVEHWEEIRAHAPIVRSEEHGGFWILTRYEDIEWAAKNPDIFSSAELTVPHRRIFHEKLIPIQLDGDVHRKWRQTLAELFNPSAVNHFTPQLRQATIDTVEPIVRKGRCELISEYASVLPSEAFLIAFGIGREHLKAFVDHKDWLRRVGIPSARTDEELRAANKPLWDFFGAAIDRRRAEGTEGRRDVISRLLHASYDGRPPTRDEMINALFVAMLASLDTTSSQLGLVFRYLATDPEAQRMVVESPESIPRIVEELIRHEPVSTTGRVVTRDVERHGVTLRKGDRVLMSWGMAGRDPDVFTDAGRVDFDRQVTRHLAFGAGPHRCLGMHLARRIIQLAVEVWHERIPSYHLTPGTAPRHHYSPALGVFDLDVTVGAPA
ncbi:cytochrome P450 [Streptomyces sp. NPDC127117]|uniref:cytochrome P450 n=1 Tax=Streptomyces sp. NPDC127117 TaxID=3345368 RepID=UPI0036454EE0